MKWVPMFYFKTTKVGDCFIRLTNTFEYAITGTGNIHLYGSLGLIVQKQLTGTGRLIEH